MLIGENFPHRAVVLIWHPAVWENVIEIIKHRIAGHARFRPLMLVRGMVENKIHHHRHARFAQGLRHRAQIVNRAERRIDLTIATDRIAAIAFAIRTFEQRHQMQIGQAELFEIRNRVNNPA